ncbi:transmembrane 4 L6 family member 5-like [Mustelus asterias]
MCPGRCARCIGTALVPLALISMGAGGFLLFPNGQTEYLMDANITEQALFLPGLWGSGIMVILAALSMQAAAANWCCCFCRSPRIKMFISVTWSTLAIIGSSTCFGASTLGLVNGPFCLFNTTLSNKTQVQLWGYPFVNRNMRASSENYLRNHSLWTMCEKPQNIVLWNIILFSTLMFVSSLEVLLCSMQLINGLVGCIVGRC